MRSSARPRLVALVVLLASLAGCTAGTTPVVTPSVTAVAPAPSPSPSPPPPLAFEAVAPSVPAVVIDVSDPVRAALDTSRALYAAAPVAVIAAADDTAAQLTAATAAVALGAPLLLTTPATALVADSSGSATSGDPVGAELDRLGATAVLVVGEAAPPDGALVVRVPAGADAATLEAVIGRSLGAATPVAAGGEAAAVAALARPGTFALAAPPTAPITAAPTASAPEPSTAAPVQPPTVGATLTAPSPTPAATAPGFVVLQKSARPPAVALPRTIPPDALAATVALTGAGAVPLAALATVRAAGLGIIDVPAADPRATSSAVRSIAAAKPAHVIAFGTAFGAPDRLAERVAAAATGVELPGGGQLYFPQDDALPGKRYVAIYGSPGMPALGVLGEQDVPATVARAQAHAEPYRALTPDTVIPGVEIIATIASAGPGPDGNYSQERSIDALLPLVQAAGAAGQTVVLDLQPGRTDFLTQAQLYEPLLELPYVGLALDPEWRLGPAQVHLKQIGHVGVDEVNAVSAWLAQLVADHHLPQKALILHEFKLSMIDGRERLDMSHDELAMVIHVDGQGGQPAKVGTWNAIRNGAPAGIHWGWKNFYDEDKPAMLDPAHTYAIQPTPDLVTYQ